MSAKHNVAVAKEVSELGVNGLEYAFAEEL